MESVTQDQIIFFLQLDPTPSKIFLELSRELNTHGIKLVPVDKETLVSLLSNFDSLQMMVALTSLSQKKRFDQDFFPIVKRILISKISYVYLASSFGENYGFSVSGMGKGLFLQLPMDVKSLVRTMAVKSQQFLGQKEKNKWPGKNKGSSALEE